MPMRCLKSGEHCPEPGLLATTMVRMPARLITNEPRQTSCIVSAGCQVRKRSSRLDAAVRADGGFLVADAADQRARNAAVHRHPLVVEATREHFAMGIEPGQQPAVAGRELDVDIVKPPGKSFTGGCSQPLHTFAGSGRDVTACG